MTDPRYDPHYANGPCASVYLHHKWTWTGGRWTCARCDAVALARRFADCPCAVCGKPIESVFQSHICGPCLDAVLGLDADENYVPFELEEKQ